MVGGRALGAMGERLGRWQGQTWAGLGVQPKGNWKSQKAFMLKGEVTRCAFPKDNSDYQKENGWQGARMDASETVIQIFQAKDNVSGEQIKKCLLIQEPKHWDHSSDTGKHARKKVSMSQTERHRCQLKMTTGCSQNMLAFCLSPLNMLHFATIPNSLTLNYLPVPYKHLTFQSPNYSNFQKYLQDIFISELSIPTSSSL